MRVKSKRQQRRRGELTKGQVGQASRPEDDDARRRSGAREQVEVGGVGDSRGVGQRRHTQYERTVEMRTRPAFRDVMSPRRRASRPGPGKVVSVSAARETREPGRLG
jgi:hypothetical protein